MSSPVKRWGHLIPRPCQESQGSHVTRKGHCQLENIKFNFRVSHLFCSITLLMASLQNRPREAPRLVQSCSMKGGLSQPWGSIHTQTTQCSRSVSSKGPRSVPPGAPGGNREERASSLMGIKPFHQRADATEICGLWQRPRCSLSPVPWRGGDL